MAIESLPHDRRECCGYGRYAGNAGAIARERTPTTGIHLTYNVLQAAPAIAVRCIHLPKARGLSLPHDRRECCGYTWGWSHAPMQHRCMHDETPPHASSSSPPSPHRTHKKPEAHLSLG
jgi:hypothetical protein